ncbi:hypothetical protein P0R31_00535 [Bradyrhizobium yuanmingense]|uniref:hypothetical protein n=1 Tax=Bradyrhizobium yuanmingense TaxID=108015 RepID=UPI0023B90F2E|nr:hypothetical protein [Bradyrhizobium yuanmingense]MDF0515730.1 hypothetical protein [Bradyrhizobium yuanmingense]
MSRQDERALALLTAAHVDLSREAAAKLPIGERDRRLRTLYQDLFGSRVTALATCPECSESLELEFDVEAFGAALEHGPAAEPAPAQLSFSRDGYDILFRLPNSRDVLALCHGRPVENNRLRLLERLVLRASCGEQEVAAADMPATLIHALDERLSLVDPHADIRLDLGCSACRAQWQAPFDIVSFLWSEVDAWALRLLRDVHRLARAYGWREADILALSSPRRQCYLELLDE